VKLPEIVNDCFVEPVVKKYVIGFPETENRQVKRLKFCFINHKDALMFARGFNSFDMSQIDVKLDVTDFIARGIQCAYLVQRMCLPLSKALLIKGE